MQSVRTAGHKKLTSQLSPMATTMVRYLFGAPFAAIYLPLAFTGDISQGLSVSFSNPSFLVYALLASITQIAATVCLVKVLALRNFAVGTVLSKTEAIQAAVYGAVAAPGESEPGLRSFERSTADKNPEAALATGFICRGYQLLWFRGLVYRHDIPECSTGEVSRPGRDYIRCFHHLRCF